eukprot:s2308_g3.t1
MSSDSDSDEVDKDLVNVTHRLGATRTPFITACCVELVFCALMTSWMSDNEHYTVFFRVHQAKIGSKKILIFVWSVFAVSVLVRFWCLCSTAKTSLARKAGRCLTVIYMFFGTVNWLLYLTTYYVAHDAASQVVRHHEVNLKLTEQDHFFKSATITPSVSKCLLDNDWSYEACGLHVSSACTKPYDPNAAYANGDCVSTVNMDGVPCCISETLKIDKPHFEVFGKEIRVSIVFMLIKWMSILLVGWVLRHGYFAAGVGTGEFSKTAYLDILDAVIFSENLNEDLVRCPAYGISSSGKPQAKTLVPYYALYATFAVAFSTVLLSQMIYTLFVPRVEEDDSEDEEGDNLLQDVEEQEGVTNKAAVAQCVRVAVASDKTFSLLDRRATLLQLTGDGTRRGHVLRRESPGMYRVKFSDGLQPTELVVSIDDLVSPDMDEAMTLEQLQEGFNDADDTVRKGCHGWLKISELNKGRRSARFEKKAMVLDALRSLLCLQVPFLLWRLYFDAFKVDILEFAGRTMLIAKNAIWAALDLVKILTCSNKEATCLTVKPMSVISSAADSKFGHVWVGPSGMVATVAEWGGMMRNKELQKSKNLIEKYHQWLLAESKETSPEMMEAYGQKLKQVELRLAVADEKMAFSFPG